MTYKLSRKEYLALGSPFAVEFLLLSLTSGVELLFVVRFEVALNIMMVINHLLEEKRIRIGRNGVKKPNAYL